MLDSLRRDVRFSVRSLRKRPAFATLAILTLALGVGGAAALFSVANGLLLRPLPYPDEDQLVAFYSPFDWRGVEFDLVKERSGTYESIAAWTITSQTLRDDGPATMIPALAVSAEFFGTLGVAPARGRTFVPGEDRGGTEPVAVVSHGLWRQELGGDPDVIGRSITLDGRAHRVIGVMPPEFYFPSPDTRLWVPLNLNTSSGSYTNNGYLALLGRLDRDATPSAVAADLHRLAEQLGAAFTYPAAWDKTRDPRVFAVREFLVGDARLAILLLSVAVTLLLVIAIANVSALQLGRASDRASEMGVRSALGASRGRLAAQLLTENVILGGIAGLAGALLAAVTFRILVSALPLGSMADTITLDASLLGLAVGISLLVGVCVGLVPLGALRGRSLRLALPGQRGETAGIRRSGVQSGLVVTEVVLAVMLVAAASLLIRSVSNLLDLELGVRPEGVLAMDLYAGSGDFDNTQRVALLEQVVTAVSGLPGVEEVGAVQKLPIRDEGTQGSMTIEDRPDLAGTERPNGYVRLVTPGFFDAIGLEIRSGRAFDANDREASLPVVVVSQSLVDLLYDDLDPIGRRIQTTFDSDWVTIVGVVDDVPMTGITGPMPAVTYRPYRQIGFAPESAALVIRGTADPASLAATIRAEVAAVDPRVAIARVATMETVVRAAIAAPLRLRFLLTLFSGLALLLGTIGVYSVLSYFVARRRQEFGIRTALGATPTDVVRQVLATGGRLIGLGIGLGLVGAVALSRVFASVLFGVAPADPIALLTAATVLALCGLAAVWLPARRAGRSDPIKALRMP